MGILVGVKGCEKQSKGCADSAGEEEQLVNLQVEMFHLLKACGKAEWHLGHWFKKKQAVVLEPSNVDVESMEKALGQRGTQTASNMNTKGK